MTVPYLDDILSMYVYACACAFFATAGGLLCSVTSIAMGSQAHTERGCSIYICRFYLPMLYIIHSFCYTRIVHCVAYPKPFPKLRCSPLMQRKKKDTGELYSPINLLNLMRQPSTVFSFGRTSR